MKTISEQQTCQVAAVESSATLLHVLSGGLTHLNTVPMVRFVEDSPIRCGQHQLSYRTQLPSARISSHHDAPVYALAPLPPVEPAPVRDSRQYYRHRMGSASLQAKEILYSTS